MVGTRGVPAKYGGFETAVEEVGRRLVDAGHRVRVYCRGEDRSASYLGMERVVLPAMRRSSTETLSHTALSVAHLVRHPTDVALVFNAANAPLVPGIRARRIPTAIHVDGLEWKRAKWGRTGQRYYLACERLAVKVADLLIADADGIKTYYRERYNADTTMIPYGAPILHNPRLDRLPEVGLAPDSYHVCVARLEPENHVDVIVEGYKKSQAKLPLAIIGDVPYDNKYVERLRHSASEDTRIKMLGSVWDQELLDALYSGSRTYLHGHSVGGTNPSLLRAMGAGASTLAWDVNFNREVLADTGQYFRDSDSIARLIDAAEKDPEASERGGASARARAADKYKWEEVSRSYEELCAHLYRNP